MPYDPRGLTFEEWGTYTAFDIAAIGNVPVEPREEDWEAFGRSLLTVPALSGLGIPDPTGFATWQAWAHQVNEGLRKLGL